MTRRKCRFCAEDIACGGVFGVEFVVLEETLAIVESVHHLLLTHPRQPLERALPSESWPPSSALTDADIPSVDMPGHAPTLRLSN
jgi:hypothetical protein